MTVILFLQLVATMGTSRHLLAAAKEISEEHHIQLLSCNHFAFQCEVTLLISLKRLEKTKKYVYRRKQFSVFLVTK